MLVVTPAREPASTATVRLLLLAGTQQGASYREVDTMSEVRGQGSHCLDVGCESISEIKRQLIFGLGNGESCNLSSSFKIKNVEIFPYFSLIFFL